MAHFGRNLTFCWCFSACFVLINCFFLAEKVFGTYGKACLFAIFALLVEQLGQWIFQWLVVCLAIAEYVDSRIDGLTQGVFICLALSGNVVGSTMIGRRTYDGQTCGIVDATLQSNRLERSQSLVVIHSQHTIEAIVGA